MRQYLVLIIFIGIFFVTLYHFKPIYAHTVLPVKGPDERSVERAIERPVEGKEVVVQEPPQNKPPVSHDKHLPSVKKEGPKYGELPLKAPLNAPDDHDKEDHIPDADKSEHHPNKKNSNYIKEEQYHKKDYKNTAPEKTVKTGKEQYIPEPREQKLSEKAASEQTSTCNGFGRIFSLNNTFSNKSPLLPFVADKNDLQGLGSTMIEPNQYTSNPEDDSETPAGYTFLGQFIDHDITLDTTSRLNRPICDEELKNVRTVDLDLDSVYGGGPEQSPHLYNSPYLRVGKRVYKDINQRRYDFLRTYRSKRSGPYGGSARALIGDPRNDENIIVAQLHSAFISFHNMIVTNLIERGHEFNRSDYCRPNKRCSTYTIARKLPSEIKNKILETAKDHVIHYYHRIILEDFLPRLVGRKLMDKIINDGRSFYFPKGFIRADNTLNKPFIPLEFSVAAFRYGHSQVRQTYLLRRGKKRSILEARSSAFKPLRHRDIVDWNYFFKIYDQPLYGFNFARKIDTMITPFLHRLGRSGVVGRRGVTSLASRNMLRSVVLKMPSGEDVADRVLSVLNAKTMLKRRYTDEADNWERYFIQADHLTRKYLGKSETPLWYYILREAAIFGETSGFGEQATYKQYVRNQHSAGHTLGPVGGTIVGEVLQGLLEHYSIKTGKGLKYRPLIRASLRPDYEFPLTLTDISADNEHAAPRYLMRNFFIDIGQDAPLR